MYYSTHLVAGATAGFVAKNPVEGFVIGVFTHIVLDMIPHHDHESVANCVLDITVGTAVFLVAVALLRPEVRVIWGAVGGVLPDVEIPLHHFGLIGKRFFPSHTGCFPHLRTTRGRGLLVQSLVIILGLWILI